MQSSYNIIKFSKVAEKGKEKIETQYTVEKEEKKESKKEKAENEIQEQNAKEHIESYENIARGILEDVRKKKEIILEKACEESEKMLKEAQEKGYKEGQEIGYKDGYEEGYTKNLEKAQIEIKAMKMEIKQKEENVIKSAREYYENYVKEKELEIKNLIINIAESILKREVKDKDVLNEMIVEALDKVKNTKMFIIKCNPIYEEALKSQVENFKSQLAFKGDIFILDDEDLKEGEALIERDNGKTKISVEEALKKVKEILFTEE